MNTQNLIQIIKTTWPYLVMLAVFTLCLLPVVLWAWF